MQNSALTRPELLLLKALQHSTNQTIDELAALAGLSKSATQRRMQRLREDKLIIAETAQLDARKLDHPMTFIVELELERDRPELMPGLTKWLNEKESIQQAWHVTGKGDLLLVILSPTVEAFDSLMERLMDQNRNVRKFTTSLALRTIKQSLRIPIDVSEKNSNG